MLSDCLVGQLRHQTSQELGLEAANVLGVFRGLALEFEQRSARHREADSPKHSGVAPKWQMAVPHSEVSLFNAEGSL